MLLPLIFYYLDATSSSIILNKNRTLHAIRLWVSLKRFNETSESDLIKTILKKRKHAFEHWWHRGKWNDFVLFDIGNKHIEHRTEIVCNKTFTLINCEKAQALSLLEKDDERWAQWNIFRWEPLIMLLIQFHIK